MYNLIIKYLKDNGETDFSKFSLGKELGDIFIKTWGYDIDEPSFTNDEIELEGAQVAKKLEIEQARDAAIYADIIIETENSGYKTFVSFSNISGELALAISALQSKIDDGEIDPVIRFPSKDNINIDMTINDYKAAQVIIANRADFYAQGRDLKDLVIAATTIAELDAITITFG